MRIPASLRRLGADARGAFRSAPLEVALGLFVAALFSRAVEGDAGLEPWIPVAVFAGVTLPLVFGCTLLHALGRLGPAARWAGTAAALAAAALYTHAVAGVVLTLDPGASRLRVRRAGGGGGASSSRPGSRCCSFRSRPPPAAGSARYSGA